VLASCDRVGEEEDAMATKNKDLKTITLHPFTAMKQGDIWDIHLKQCRGNVVAALRAWADRMEFNARGFRVLAEVMKDAKGLKGSGDTHMIFIDGLTPELLKRVLESSPDLAVEEDWPCCEDEDCECNEDEPHAGPPVSPSLD
jgi:hypothetical protein